MKIRKATANDIESIKLLWKEMMEFHFKHDSYFELNPVALDKYHEYLKDNLRNDKKVIFVALDHDKAVGYVTASIEEYPPIYLFDKYLMIGEISVSEKLRRNGTGKRLLNEVLSYAKKQNITRIECQVAVNNPVSQSFWIKNEFRPYIHTMVKEI
jgi:ribosomal protein S18 acetylase RimI-like enzyme